MTELEKLLTVREVANLLRVSEDTVRRYAQRGELGASKIGKDWRIPATGVTSLLERRSVVAPQS